MGHLSKTLAALSASMILSAGATQARSVEDEITLKDIQAMEQSSKTDHLERFNTAETGNWVVRIPEQSGYRNQSVSSLDEALQNPNLKNHIYLPGIGGFQTPLAYATINNDIGLMNKCLSAGVNPDAGMIGKVPGPESPLAKAVNSYFRFKTEGRDVSVQKQMISTLLEVGATPNIRVTDSVQPESANTPLHVMATLRDNAMIDLLIKHGADTSVKRDGQTPQDVYNAELTDIGGGKLSWRGEKNPVTATKLTPKSRSLLNKLFSGHMDR